MWTFLRLDFEVALAGLGALGKQDLLP
jgi:hypothetical protein